MSDALPRSYRPNPRLVDVWVPGNLVDLEALKREYDTIVFTRVAVRRVADALGRAVGLLESPGFDDGEGRDEVEGAIDEAQVVLARLREVL